MYPATLTKIMSQRTGFCLALAILLVTQNGLCSKLTTKVNGSVTENFQTAPGQRKHLSRLGYTDKISRSVNVTRSNGNAVPIDNAFVDESLVRLTPSSVATLSILRKGDFSEGNENQKNKMKYDPTVKKPWHLNRLHNELKRDTRSFKIRKERAVSSHISLQTTDTTVRVEYSGDSSTELLQDLRPLECRYITNDNRRLIENLIDTINCGSFPPVENGHFELFLGDLDEDIEPRIKCDRYYVRRGPINGGLICANGEWQFDASCEKIPCRREFEIPLNGQNISMTGHHFNDTVTFSCLYGYELVGDELLVCGEDGEWIGYEPTCKLVQCPNVTAPENGFVSADLDVESNQTSLAETDFNTTITYRCKGGYTLVGKSESTCQADGRWSQRRKPQCKQVCLVPFSNRLTSTVWLQPIMNPVKVRTEFKFGQQIIYLCKKRYKSDNDGGSMCINGEWIPPIRCHRIYTCTDPSAPQNGQIAHRINKSFIQFSCNYGYQISGSETQTCLANGTWSGIKPECRKMCQMPQVFAMKNAWLSFQFKKFKQGNQLLVGSVIEYSCKSGYKTAINVPSTCDDGDWIPTPLCISTIVRLTGARGTDEGLVEVYINGNWGLVCDHTFVHFGKWGGNESKVVCKMLGYAFGNRQEPAHYQRITRHISYQSVSCTGDEQSILECNTMRAKVWCNRFIAVKCYKRMSEF